jgi:hypothetical protein
VKQGQQNAERPPFAVGENGETESEMGESLAESFGWVGIVAPSIVEPVPRGLYLIVSHVGGQRSHCMFPNKRYQRSVHWSFVSWIVPWILSWIACIA